MGLRSGRRHDESEGAMTTQEIIELAGHRDVPAWVMKLVADCVEKEREACALLCSVRSHRDNDMGAILARVIRARGQQ